MRQLLSFLFIILVAVAATRMAGPAPRGAEAGPDAQEADGCAGQWLMQITFEGRDVVEEAIGEFADDDRVTLHSPSIVPALPESGDDPVFTSDAVGGWRESGDGGCAFEAVRLLAAEDGVGLGRAFFRGTATIDDSGLGLDGSFTYDQSTGFGKTVASGSGTLVGTSISK